MKLFQQVQAKCLHLWICMVWIPCWFPWNDKIFLRWQFHVWEMQQKHIIHSNIGVKQHSSPPRTQTHTHIHRLRNAHILLLPRLSQVWNSFEKYKWNSHTLGIHFSHSLALFKSGQCSSSSSCWAADGLRVSGEVKPELLPVRALQSFFILL